MTGVEWIVEAHGCSPDRLRDVATLRLVFERIVSDLGLHPVGDALWHRFPHSGGLTGVTVLAESHLACHSFPEYGTICLNLFCCRARPDWDFAGQLRALLHAAAVSVRRLDRPYKGREGGEGRDGGKGTEARDGGEGAEARDGGEGAEARDGRGVLSALSPEPTQPTQPNETRK